MLEDIKANVKNTADEGQIADYLAKIIKKEAGDGSGLIYGMGHAVYTLSDPRAKLLKQDAAKYSAEFGYKEDFRILDTIERLPPELFCKYKGIKKKNLCKCRFVFGSYIFNAQHSRGAFYADIYGFKVCRLVRSQNGGNLFGRKDNATCI